MTTVYVVTQDTNGAHEPEGFLSIWNSLDLAETERARLCQLEFRDEHSFHVVAVRLNTPSDDTLA